LAYETKPAIISTPSHVSCLIEILDDKCKDMADTNNPAVSPLRWSSQLTVTSPLRTPKLPGDKILLPPSALEQLLAAAPVVTVEGASHRPNHAHTSTFDPFNPYTFAAETRARAFDPSTTADIRQPQLPHPLTFRLVNPVNGRAVYAGIREFSAEEGQVTPSSFLRHALGIDESKEEKASGIDGVESGENYNNIDNGLAAITVHAQQLPKGTYVRLRPLEAGYDPEDWKALLERHLRENFTTLTVGELLTVPGGWNRHFEFLIDKVAPEGNAICIVDTDLEVDIEPLNEEQARETLKKLSQKASRKPGTEKGSSPGGPIAKGQDTQGRVRRGEYVDYEIPASDLSQGTLQLELEVADGVDLDIFVSPLSPYQRSYPRSDEYVFGDVSSKSYKTLKLQSSLPELVDAEKLYVSVHAFIPPIENDASIEDDTEAPLEYILRVSDGAQVDGDADDTSAMEHDSGDVQCKNCQQWVPQRTLFLHENFCLRNNILCPRCKNVFQKSSTEWQNHWHCDHDDSHGNDIPSKEKHDFMFHNTHPCSNCDYVATSLPALGHHRTTRCPGKSILCQFCHLVVPQQGDSDPDINDPEVLLSGLAPHEIVDGGRTTECHLCNKITRLRDMKTHLRHHDLERLSRPAPATCRNINCGRTLKVSKPGSADASLGLCSICFAPLYTDAHDPEGKALKRRIERRYLSQMLTGCGKPWCCNVYCKTGHQRSSSTSAPSTLPTSSREILQVIKPLIDAINTNPAQFSTISLSSSDLPPLYLCADETSQQRRTLGEMITAEGVYDIRWCLAALEASGGDLDKARDWLGGWAPKKGEMR
jgi:Ubiquitin fusion degradation protein UFD1/Amino-terminal Zinc-binding domain of ubiquitin ligase E3A